MPFNLPQSLSVHFLSYFHSLFFTHPFFHIPVSFFLFLLRLCTHTCSNVMWPEELQQFTATKRKGWTTADDVKWAGLGDMIKVSWVYVTVCNWEMKSNGQWDLGHFIFPTVELWNDLLPNIISIWRLNLLCILLCQIYLLWQSGKSHQIRVTVPEFWQNKKTKTKNAENVLLLIMHFE